jgi:DNA processing protein
MSWDHVAAPGTDPAQLAATVALLTDATGRAVLRAAAAAAAGSGSGSGSGLGSGQIELGCPATRAPDRAQRAAAQEVAIAWTLLGVRAAVAHDPAWPARLARIPGPPFVLAWRGPEKMPDRPAVAIVGARRATPYGTGVAAWLAEAAGQAGATVVSGGARGIDAAAHGAATAYATTVVLGCGHDVLYPRPHAVPGGLFDRVIEGGGAIVSELLPGTQPRPGAVRARNRIVAGLADVVVVVEGRAGSGALLTATAAGEAGVAVLAVPGDVRAPGSVAPHLLLREGAEVCTGPYDLLESLRAAASLAAAPVGGPQASSPTPAVLSVLPARMQTVLAAAWPRPLTTVQLAEAAGLSVPRTLAAVVAGRVAGELAEGPEGVRQRRAPTG